MRGITLRKPDRINLHIALSIARVLASFFNIHSAPRVHPPPSPFTTLASMFASHPCHLHYGHGITVGCGLPVPASHQATGDHSARARRSIRKAVLPLPEATKAWPANSPNRHGRKSKSSQNHSMITQFGPRHITPRSNYRRLEASSPTPGEGAHSCIQRPATVIALRDGRTRQSKISSPGGRRILALGIELHTGQMPNH